MPSRGTLQRCRGAYLRLDPSEFGVRSSANSIILFSHLVCSMILFNYKGRGRATRIHGGGLSIAPSAAPPAGAARGPRAPVTCFKLTVTVTTILYGGVIMCSDERSGARAAFAGDVQTARAHETSRLTCTPAHNSPRSWASIRQAVSTDVPGSN